MIQNSVASCRLVYCKMRVGVVTLLVQVVCNTLDRLLTLDIEKQREVRRLVDWLDKDLSEKKLPAAGKPWGSHRSRSFDHWLTIRDYREG